MSKNTNTVNLHSEEFEMKAINGMACMISNILAELVCIAAFVIGVIFVDAESNMSLGIVLMVIGGLYGFIVSPVIFVGLKVLKPNEAYVLTLFGRYVGTLKGAGFYWVNPFCVPVNPASETAKQSTGSIDKPATAFANAMKSNRMVLENRRISLKVMTLSNDKQKINDQLGNPIIIGIVVIWKVVNTVKAVFSVDNFKEFLSIQCDSALRDIVRLYPYDTANDNEKSLRGSSVEVAERLRAEIQSKVETAGLEIIEARITHLSYSEEIAAAMLQRQQASAIIDARQMIVDGAVGMVEMALEKLSKNNIVRLDEERKAAMVSNLLVVLCGNKDAQPIVNSGSLY
jgi:regulator of protease activity HflC (stomatin/prohibitin superfamily)